MSFGAAPAPTQVGKDKMEPRLLSLLHHNDVHNDIMDRLGDAGVVKLNVFVCIGKPKEKFIEVIAKDPIKVKSDTFEGSLEQAKLLSAWESAVTLKEVEVKHTAERMVQKMPPQLQVGDLENAVKVFEKHEHALTKFTTPSEAFFELLQGQIESYYKPISLTHVTSLDNQDTNKTSSYGIDMASGLLRATAQKP